MLVSCPCVSPRSLCSALVALVVTAALGLACACGVARAKAIDANEAVTVTSENPALSIDDVTHAEGDDGVVSYVFTIRLSAPSPIPVRVDVRTADSTATLADDDYAPFQFTITFDPGVTEQQMSVGVRGDHRIELDEQFLVQLTNVQGAALVDSVGIGTIQNDDVPRFLSIEDAVTLEGDAGTHAITFTLHLSPPAIDPIVVTATTFDGSAQSGDGDYEPATTQIAFAPGDSVATFAVQVVGDTLVEPTERFSVQLSALQGAFFADSLATGTIQYDDLPTLAIADASLPEGNGGIDSLRFALRLSAPAPDTASVTATTLDSTARTADRDYNARSVTLEILPGDTAATFAVAVLGDKRVEPDEFLRVTLASVTHARWDGREAIGTIVNDDLPVLSVSDTAMAEGARDTTWLRFRVQLSSPPIAPVTFHYQTIDGTAQVADSDYVAIAGDTTFAPGQTLIVLAVPALGDTLLEGNDRFTLALSAIQGATPSESSAIGTIANDEHATFTRFTTTVPDYPYGTLPPAFGDVNGDGRPDLPLYMNMGGTFVEMAGVRKLLSPGNFHGAAWCDYDRDGDMDFVQMPYGQAERAANKVHLINNTGTGLVDVAPALGLDIVGFGETPTWADFDADGWPDLFLPFYAHDLPGHSFLYMNQAGTSFREFADSAGVALRNLPPDRRPEGTAVVDWNGDGALDLYCANKLFLNDGNAHFTDVRTQVGLPQVFDEGCQFVDYDDDGDFDLYLRVASGPLLYRNDAGHFTDVTATLGIGTLDWEWGDRWADLDGDGDEDLLYFMPNTEGRLLLNQGDGTFREDSTFRGALIGSTLSSFADIDGDGDLDIAAGANGRQFARNRAELLARAHTNYLRVRLEDDDGKLVMQGATVRLRSLDDPRHPVQSRIVDGGSGYLGQDEYTLTFSGLGSGAYDLEVTFPSKPGHLRVVGPAQNAALGGLHPGVGAPQVIVVRPGGEVLTSDDGYTTAAAPPIDAASGARVLGASPNPARSATRLAFTAGAAGRTTVQIMDVHGRRVRTLVHEASEDGRSESTWDLCDDAGQRVPAGLYFARLAGSTRANHTQRIVVVH